MVTDALAVISARGGSKRIPRKNIINFFGKPLMAWSIRAAIDSGVFRKVIVSTDDPEIAQIARAHGAEVPFMRERFADDFSPISTVVADAVEIMRDRFGENYDVVAQIMPNCPMRTAEDIRDAHRNFTDNKLDFQLSSFAYGWMNPWWAFKIGEDGTPSPLNERGLKSRSQDLEKLYCPTGAIWLAKTAALLQSKNFYGPGFRLHPIPWQSAVDIDDYEDREMARAVYLMRNGSGH
jgi:CMP-N-acetylneuraminic acid synthetase